MSEETDTLPSLRFLARRALAVDTLDDASAELWFAFTRGSWKLVDRFDDDGRCTEFREWFMQPPKSAAS